MGSSNIRTVNLSASAEGYQLTASLVSFDLEAGEAEQGYTALGIAGDEGPYVDDGYVDDGYVEG